MPLLINAILLNYIATCGCCYFWLYILLAFSLPSNRQHLSCDVCLEVRGEFNWNYSVSYCVLKLCTVICTLYEQLLQFLDLGFVTLGPFHCAYIDLFVSICVYFVCFCFILHSCHNIVSAVGWT